MSSPVKYESNKLCGRACSHGLRDSAENIVVKKEKAPNICTGRCHGKEAWLLQPHAARRGGGRGRITIWYVREGLASTGVGAKVDSKVDNDEKREEKRGTRRRRSVFKPATSSGNPHDRGKRATMQKERKDETCQVWSCRFDAYRRGSDCTPYFQTTV